MSTAPTPPSQAATTPPPPPSGPESPRELKLISHSNLFYWWPVWALGFFMAGWTYFEDHRLAVMPADATVTKRDLGGGKAEYVVQTGAVETRSLKDAVERTADPKRPAAFRARVSQHTWMGPIFCLGILLTMVITNVPLRGLWSFLVIILLVVVALLFSLFNVWEDLFVAIGNLHIYINMAGYLFIATAVFILWGVATLVVDRRNYIVFTPGQIRVCEHIGASVRNFDTMGMTFEKQRDDLFRHYILGFGSGDLIVRTSGAHSEEIRLPNVLGLGWKLDAIQDIVREKTTVIDHTRKG